MRPDRRPRLTQRKKLVRGKKMSSGAFSLLFGIVISLIGAVFAWYGWSEQYWAALGISLAFILYGFLVVRNAIAWLRLRPASSLRLYGDHFCIGTRRFSYLELHDVSVKHNRTKKTLNFLPGGSDETVFASLQLTTQLITLRAGSGPATLFGPSFGQNECENFLQRIDLLRRRAAELQSSTRQIPSERK